MNEREKYEAMHREHPGYGATNHGAGTEHLLDDFLYRTLLDVGGGFSTYAAGVKARGYIKHAAVTDISEAPRVEQLKRGVTFHCVAALDMQLGHFDVVTAFDVLEHFPVSERDRSIANIYAHAKRRLIFSIGHLRSTSVVNGREVTLHHTVENREWWVQHLRKFGGELRLEKLPSVISTGERRETVFFIVDLQ